MSNISVKQIRSRLVLNAAAKDTDLSLREMSPAASRKRQREDNHYEDDSYPANGSSEQIGFELDDFKEIFSGTDLQGMSHEISSFPKFFTKRNLLPLEVVIFRLRQEQNCLP